MRKEPTLAGPMGADSPLDASDYAFAVVVSSFHEAITSKLLAGAQQAFRESKASDVEIFYVPGAFELPLAAKLLADTGDYDAIVCLGCVVRGETPHFDFVAAEAAHGIQKAMLKTDVPMSFGVLTTETMEQAVARSGSGKDNKGWEAARTAMVMALFVALLPDPNDSDPDLPVVDDERDIVDLDYDEEKH
ncbi:MAG: hypothetical protein NVSMB57_11700 [Actinomycetota bacterium]